MHSVRHLLLAAALLAAVLTAGPVTGCSPKGPAPPKPAQRSRIGPACDDLVESSDCPAGTRCCPLPPGLYEMPMCLPVCTGKPEEFCRELLGGIATCNPRAGCCHFPKTLIRRDASPPGKPK